MEKDFGKWGGLKKSLNKNHNVPTFKEREVWWSSIGVNIGHEQDGKGKMFNRPVLIVKKFNYRLFWGVPLTTQVKDNKHYHKFIFQDMEQCAMLTQLRLWDAVRLTHKMERLAEKEFNAIRLRLVDYLK